MSQIAQMAVALISLTYSVGDGTDYRGTFIRDGNVNASDLSCYHRLHSRYCAPPAMGQALARDYGEYASSYECGNYTEIAEVLNSDSNHPFYCRNIPHMQKFAYRFNEYNIDDKQKSYPYFSNRTITTWSGDCFTYDGFNITHLPDVNGNGAGWNISYKNNSFENHISIPKSSLGKNGTTYIYRDINPPPEAKEIACGDRCITMWAYENPESHPRLYQCPINVSPVSNATQDAHKIPDGVARLAAASIALQGRWGGRLSNRSFTQYQFYAYG